MPNDPHLVARANLAFLGHVQIKPRSAAQQEPLHHIRAIEANRQLEARHAWLRHREFRRTNLQAIPDTNRVLEQTFSREIFSESAPGKSNTGKLRAPEGVML